MRLEVSSSVIISRRPELVWPLLCNFKLPKNPKWYLKSLPFPQECKVIGKKGVGALRRCKTTKCHLNQRITEWVPPNKLSFIVLSDDKGILRHVKRLEYTLVLEEVSQGTLMTCHTRLDMELHPILETIRRPLLRFSMRKLQEFTISGIKILAERQEPVIRAMT